METTYGKRSVSSGGLFQCRNENTGDCRAYGVLQANHWAWAGIRFNRAAETSEQGHQDVWRSPKAMGLPSGCSAKASWRKQRVQRKASENRERPSVGGIYWKQDQKREMVSCGCIRRPRAKRLAVCCSDLRQNPVQLYWSRPIPWNQQQRPAAEKESGETSRAQSAKSCLEQPGRQKHRRAPGTSEPKERIWALGDWSGGGATKKQTCYCCGQAFL